MSVLPCLCLFLREPTLKNDFNLRTNPPLINAMNTDDSRSPWPGMLFRHTVTTNPHLDSEDDKVKLRTQRNLDRSLIHFGHTRSQLPPTRSTLSG